MGSSTAARASATKRCAVAAAGFGMVLASFAGASASANASTHITPHHRVAPNLAPPPPTPALSLSTAAPVDVATTTIIAGTSVALPTVTLTDPGIIVSGQTVRLDLESGALNVSLDSTVTPTVTATGATVSAATVADNHVTFTVTKTNTSDDATYTVSGIHLIGTSGVTSGDFGLDVATSGPAPQPGVATLDVGAVSHLVPAAYGETAPDTAALLFDDSYHNDSAVVLASDYEPQDAESANYLAGALAGENVTTGVLLTDPTTLSPAAKTAIDDTSDASTVYIVGGTSVVSAGIQTELESDGYTVIRLAGADQYATNQFVVNYVAANLHPAVNNYPINYTQTQYNDTSGTSSPTTTGIGPVKTAIVASGSIDSFQDGIVSGPVSYYAGLPVILTTPGSLSSTAQKLLTEGSYKQVILLGGPDAVSDSVVSQLTASTDSGGAGVSVFRVAGQDASDTSTKLASFITNDGPFDPTDDGTFDGGVLITRGTGFQDALAAGPYAGGNGDTPILLTENATTLGAPLTAYLKSMGEEHIFAAQAIGGPLSVTPDVQQAAIDAEFSGLPSDTAPFSATVPSAPTLVSITNGGGANQVILSFDFSDFDGGSGITGYQYSNNSGATWNTLNYSGANPATSGIGATATVPYTYEVRAVNGVGVSAASNAIVHTR